MRSKRPALLFICPWAFFFQRQNPSQTEKGTKHPRWQNSTNKMVINCRPFFVLSHLHVLHGQQLQKQSSSKSFHQKRALGFLFSHTKIAEAEHMDMEKYCQSVDPHRYRHFTGCLIFDVHLSRSPFHIFSIAFVNGRMRIRSSFSKGCDAELRSSRIIKIYFL